jgi:hypothetical protein
MLDCSAPEIARTKGSALFHYNTLIPKHPYVLKTVVEMHTPKYVVY